MRIFGTYLKINKQVWTLLFFIGLSFISKAQKYPQNIFRYPLDSLPNFVSPFGVLRDNHFHSGIDLRTNGREGLPVYAAADGFISRIKIQRSAYGKALYIDHGNGFSTVYGHLQKYHGAIAEWIHNYQYVNESFEFDKIFITPFLWVKKGDTIGWSGNSGTSSGPHLHYEIRDSKTEKIVNPGLFGLLPIDSLKPTIFKVHVYKFVTEGLLLKSKLLVQPKNTYIIDSFLVFKDTLNLDPDVYGFGIEAYDYIHNSVDEKGIYEYNLLKDDKLVFKHVLNQFAFDETKYINAHIDFPYYKIEKTRLQKCFVDDGNVFSTYTHDGTKGRINLTKLTATTGSFLFVVKDINGNVFYLQLPYKVGQNQIDLDRENYQKSILGKSKLIPGKAQVVGVPDFEVKMNPKSVYDTVYYEINTLFGQQGSFSNEFSFHNANVPVHAAFDVAVRVKNIPFGYEDKLLLVYRPNKSSGIRPVGGNYTKGWVRGKGSNFGMYSIYIDTIAPKVKWLNSKPADSLKWSFEITDNFSGITKFSAYLNGRWLLLDFDAKNDLLTYDFDEVYFSERDRVFNLENDPGHAKVFELVLRIEDSRGNIQERLFNMVPK